MTLAPLTVGRFFGTWTFDPWATGFVVIVFGAYLAGVRTAGRRGVPWPAVRTAAFAALGLGPVVLATMSSMAVYGHVLLWPLALQVSLLLTIVPVGLGCGDPLRLVAVAISPAHALRWRRILRSRIVQILTFPVVAPLLVVGTQFVVFFTGYLRAAEQSGSLMHLLQLQLVITGCLFALPILGAEVLPAWCTQPVRLAVAAIDGLLDAIPGITVMTSATLVAGGYYGTVARSWGPTHRWDQTIAGGLLLTVAEVVAMPFIAILYGAWTREDGSRAREIDRALDLEESRQAAREDQRYADGVPIERSVVNRPWWEVDPGPLADRATRYGWREEGEE